MAAVDIVNVSVLENPATFTSPIQFEITYEVREALEDDIEWKVTYVGSAEDESYDQDLDVVLLPADAVGRFGFVLQVDAPKFELLPEEDVLGVTIILLSCSYKDKEFIRVGYYVNNEYVDPELAENPPAHALVHKIVRNIGADQPRVTKFPHKFDFVGDATTVDGQSAKCMTDMDMDMDEPYWGNNEEAKNTSNVPMICAMCQKDSFYIKQVPVQGYILCTGAVHVKPCSHRGRLPSQLNNMPMRKFHGEVSGGSFHESVPEQPYLCLKVRVTGQHPRALLAATALSSVTFEVVHWYVSAPGFRSALTMPLPC
ncbi:Histone chaperone ASF1B [Porphyridium purpureum]|uniref:Histone chaperone ASF1B n=1 Tax=Porphyridium purpureum TaxID=35688 RepID=A0A5J4Z2L2_PORPP|nr:Histone chaperone ASF1B [Porphyridium purpureum]|eukprot:POR1053..scf295_1